MERCFCLFPIVGGILILLYPSQARKVYAAFSPWNWQRDFTLRCSDLAFRILGIVCIVLGVCFLFLEQTTPH